MLKPAASLWDMGHRARSLLVGMLAVASAVSSGCSSEESKAPETPGPSVGGPLDSSLARANLVLYAYPKVLGSVPTDCFAGTPGVAATPAGRPPCPWLGEAGAVGTYMAPLSSTVPMPNAARWVTDPDPYSLQGGDRNTSTPAVDPSGPEITVCGGNQQVVHNSRVSTDPNGGVSKVLRLGGGIQFPTSILRQESGTVAMWIKAGTPPAINWLGQTVFFFALNNADTLKKPVGYPADIAFDAAIAGVPTVGSLLPYNGVWSHVIATWSGNQATLYRDGSYVGYSRAESGSWLSSLSTAGFFFTSAIMGCPAPLASGEPAPPCDQMFMKDLILLNRAVSDDEAMQLCVNGRQGIQAAGATVPARRVSATLTGAIRSVSPASVCEPAATRSVQRKLDASLSLRGVAPSDFATAPAAATWRGQVDLQRSTGGSGASETWSAAIAGCATPFTATSFSEHLSLSVPVSTACPALTAGARYRLVVSSVTASNGSVWAVTDGPTFQPAYSAPFSGSPIPWLDGPVSTTGTPSTAFPSSACDRISHPPSPWNDIARALDGRIAVDVSTTDAMGLGNRSYDWTLAGAKRPFPAKIRTTVRAPGPVDTGAFEDVLVSPIQLLGNGTEATLPAAVWTIPAGTSAFDRVSFGGTGTVGGVAYSVSTNVDYDGLIWTTLTIPNSTGLTSLAIKFELNPQLATHMHTTVPFGRSISETPGAPPAEAYYTHTSGEITSILNSPRTPRAGVPSSLVPRVTYQESWGQTPMVWIGAPRGGLQVTTADTVSWVGPRDGQVSISRNTAGNVVLSLNLMQSAGSGARTFKIGIQATPVRGYAPGARDRDLHLGGGRNIDGLRPAGWDAWDRVFSMNWNRTSERGVIHFGSMVPSNWTWYDLAQRDACRMGGYDATGLIGEAICRSVQVQADSLRSAVSTALSTFVQDASRNQLDFYWDDYGMQPQGARSQFLYWAVGNVWGGDPALQIAGPEWGVAPSLLGPDTYESPGATHATMSQNDFQLASFNQLLNWVAPALSSVQSTDRLCQATSGPYRDAAHCRYPSTSVIAGQPLHSLIGGYYLDVTTPYGDTSVWSTNTRWTVENTRDLLKRIYQTDKSLPNSDKRPIVNHTSDGSNASNLAFSDINVTGEHQFSGYPWCNGNRVEFSYRELLTPERLRAEYTGTRIGVQTAIVPEFGANIAASSNCAAYIAAYNAAASGGTATRGGVDWFWSNGTASTPSDSYVYSEHFAGIAFAHDVGLWGTQVNPFPLHRLSAVKDRFGWDDTVTFIPYWDNTATPSRFFKLSACPTGGSCSYEDDKTTRFASMYVKQVDTCKRRILVVAMNNAATAADYSLTVFWSNLGLNAPSSTSAAPFDPYNSPALPFRKHWLPGGAVPAAPSALTGALGGPYSFRVNPWNFRLIQIETTSNKCAP